MYFAVAHGQTKNEYQLFQNTVYAMTATFKTNVIWPINNIEPTDSMMRLRNENQQSSNIRAWNNTKHMDVNWAYTGSSIQILLRNFNMVIIAPIISMSYSDYMKLPYNASSFNPRNFRFINEKENIHTYTAAYFYTTDPNSDENTFEIPAPVYAEDSIPIAPVVAAPVPVAAPMAAPVPVAAPMPVAAPVASLPPHIAKIVLADAIRKNDVCPITSEDITETNATVTPCGHVFTTAAIAHWLSIPSSRGLCPVCKQKCC
jgi:hypothetical protein